MVNLVGHLVNEDRSSTSSDMVSGNQRNSETVERFFTEFERQKPNRYSPEQLEIFTSNFSKSLGSGSFGEVFKGKLDDGVHVAVKVLKERVLSDNIQEQFKAEVLTLGRIHHRNLVRLYGFCFEPKLKALIYEFMENESLDKILRDDQNMKWETLRNIAIGTANGLSYLHQDCQPRIIHYDIKPSNILLDSKFSPKVGDFGLAKLLNMDITHVTMSGFRGTASYGAPELWTPSSEATHKCDVYSYGILLFEILGRRHHLGERQKWFPRQVWEKFEKGQEEEVMTECGIEEKDKEQAKRILMIALWCVHFLPSDRPSMSLVARLLEGREEVEMPPNPFWHLKSSSMSRLRISTREKLSYTHDWEHANMGMNVVSWNSGGGLLVVIIHDAEDVEGKHHTNPYVRIRFRGEERETKHVKKNRDPRWEEEFSFTLEEPPTNDRMRVEVISASSRTGILHPKETLGYIDINLSDVVSNKRINETYYLIDSSNGKIHIELQWRILRILNFGED